MTHKKMFQFLTLSLFVALVLFAPLAVQADCQKKADMKAEACKKMGEGCIMSKHIPNLSDEQKGKLEKLCAEHMKMMAAAKADMEKQALEMKALLKDPVDVKKIEAKIDEIAKLKADMQKKCLAHRLAVRALLTDEQKAKFDEIGCCGMGCGMMGGMGMMGGKCGMKGHGMKMEKGKCPKAKEEEKK